MPVKVMICVNLPLRAINAPELLGKEIEVWTLAQGTRLRVEGIEYDHEHPEMVTLNCLPLDQQAGALTKLMQGKRRD